MKHSRSGPGGFASAGADPVEGPVFVAIEAAGPRRRRSRYSTLPILRTAAIRRALSSSTKRAKSAASW